MVGAYGIETFKTTIKRRKTLDSKESGEELKNEDDSFITSSSFSEGNYPQMREQLAGSNNQHKRPSHGRNNSSMMAIAAGEREISDESFAVKRVSVAAFG